MTTQKSLFNIFSSTPPKWDKDFMIKQIPPEWFPLRERKFWWCAHYSLKAVIEWKWKKSRPIEDYSCDWRSRNT